MACRYKYLVANATRRHHLSYYYSHTYHAATKYYVADRSIFSAIFYFCSKTILLLYYCPVLLTLYKQISNVVEKMFSSINALTPDCCALVNTATSAATPAAVALVSTLSLLLCIVALVQYLAATSTSATPTPTPPAHRQHCP